MQASHTSNNKEDRSVSKAKVCIAIFVILVSGIGSALADVLTYVFTGTVTSINGSPFGLTPAVGEKLRGSISYDPTQPGDNFTCGAKYIQATPSGMSLTISGVTLRSANYNSFEVINNCFDFHDFNGYFAPIKVGGVEYSEPSGLTFGLTDHAQKMFNSVALPLSLDVKSFDQRGGGGFDSTNKGSFNFSIDTLIKPFAGTSGNPNCQDQSVSALAKQYDGLDAAARILGYPSVQALEDAITAYCQR